MLRNNPRGLVAARIREELVGSNWNAEVSRRYWNPPKVFGCQVSPPSTLLNISENREPARIVLGFFGSIARLQTSRGETPVSGSISPSLIAVQLAAPSVLLKIPTLSTPSGVSVPA